MVYIIFIITEVLLYFAINDFISNEVIYKNWKIKIICGLLWVFTIILFGTSKYREEIFVFICLLWLYIYRLVSYKGIENFKDRIVTIIAIIAIYIVMSVIIAVPCGVIYYQNETWMTNDQRDLLISTNRILVSVVLNICRTRMKIKHDYIKKNLRNIVAILGIPLILVYQIGLHLFDHNQKLVSIVLYNVLLFVMIFGILWLIDHYRLSKGKLKAEQDSSRMNADLHRSKELMPLLLSVVNENQELLDPQIVEEFQRIYAEQMIVGKRENMNYKLMGTTGIMLLDSHLQHYIMECARKNIVMDVFVSEPIEDDMRELKIAQLQMHNIMGDMIRNAIRAIERENKTDGKILVIIGKKEAGMEIVVYDNGQRIPEMVLEKFGERGVTTGGTGNGLADLVDLLDMYDGSLVIEEKDASSSAYTKGIHLVFDGKCRRELYTVHTLPKKIYENGFWTKIENVENG